MKANFLALGLFGLAGASAVLPRDYPEDKKYEPKTYEPKTYDDSYEPKTYDDSYKPSKPTDYPSESYPTKAPKKDYPTGDSYPSKDYPSKDYPSKDYPSKDYPSKDYPSKDYPSKDYPSKDYPSKGYPASDDYADEGDYEDGYDYKNKNGYDSTWKPKSKTPEFFNLRVDEACAAGEAPTDCPFNGYAIRLEGGIFIATPYNKWWDPKLPTFFVDDDTQLYTVSKDPLQVYIDGVTGALKYTKIGWLPPNAISISFYHTGNNPLGLVDPSPSYLSWPSTQGGSFYGQPWSLCPLGSTQQYQVFINNENFGIGGPAGVAKDPASCAARNLAAVNANPWKHESSPAPYYPPQPYPGYGGSA